MKINNTLDHNNIMNIRDEELIEKWFSRNNISKGTQKSYRIALRYYTQLLTKTTQELIDEAENDETGGILPRKRKIYKYLLKYKKYLKDRDMAPSTLNLYFYAIKSFYDAFDIRIPIIKVNYGDMCLDKNIGRSLTRKDIRKLISVASPREKALICLMALSGIGQQDARNLTIGKLITSASSAIGKELDDVYDLFKFEEDILSEVLTVEINMKNVKYIHHTFLPPETTKEMINYLKERCYGHNIKIRIKNNDDTLFVTNYGGKLSRDNIVSNFRRLGTLAGLKREKGTYSYWRVQALRTYFISMVINKIGTKIVAYYIAGLKIDNQDRIYWKSAPEDLKKLYLKVLPYLDLDKKVHE